VRITPIYEGTNGIQAMDLVGRKLMDGGEMAFRLLQERRGSGRDPPAPRCPIWPARSGRRPRPLREATEWMLAPSTDDRNAGAVAYLRAFARVLGGHYHLRAALADPAGPRARLARVFVTGILPEHASLLVRRGPGPGRSMRYRP
jgi:acyl-CoA dehydrogenase